MKKNLGTLDRGVRLLAGVVLVILYATGMISGTVALILGLVALVLLLTSFVGTCPAYLPFGFSTRSKAT